MKILVLNAGSSSQKSRLYELDQAPALTPPAPLWEADADWSKTKDQTSIKIMAHGQTQSTELPTTSRVAVTEYMLKTLWTGQTRVVADPSEIAIVGHRVVHGGPDYSKSTLITPEVEATIQRLITFAPLHNPASLDGIKAARQILDKTPQIAVFDTAFHSQIPAVAATYPGPYSWHEEGIRRYGFHGTSHQYCAQRSAQILERDLAEMRIINCHLGNGCSLAAIQHGHSIDTTMGFTPLEGLMMGSRSGTVDPSILTYLQRTHHYDADRLDQILNKESGLKGISGISNDIREIEKAIQQGNERAKLAMDIYIYRIRSFIGAMLAALGGVDVLTFTGGVGENAASVRTQTCTGFGFLKLEIDTEKNAQSPVDQDISTPTSAVRILVVHTEEDWQIAKECWYMQQKKAL